jgi:hypothetical protein
MEDERLYESGHPFRCRRRRSLATSHSSEVVVDADKEGGRITELEWLTAPPS